MNTEALHVALQQSFSPDASLRDPAEATIKNLKNVPGASAMLLQVASEKQVQFEVRQAAAIHLKNLCRECWIERLSFLGNSLDEQGKIILMGEEDKLSVRINLVEALLSEPEKSIRDLMAETVHSISIHDYPEKWPNLLPTLLQTISQSNDPSQALRVHNALLALRKVCKRYEYKAKEQRGPLNEIVSRSFPLLLPLAQRLCDPNEHSLEAALMLKQILKIFWSSTQFYLPGDQTGAATPSMSNPQAMQPWFDVLKTVLSKPLPEASTGLEPKGQPDSVEERNAWPWWKVKKWSVQIMSRLFSRYGNVSYTEDELKDFARYFSQNVAPQFLGPVCETLNLRPSGQFCTDRVIHLCLNFVDVAVELAPTYKMLKPHLDFLLYKVCFPTMCLTKDDVELFETDPHEFIHKQNSPLADFYDPRMSAITLMTSLVKHRGKDVIPGLLAFLTDILQRYNASDEASKNHIEKDGSLLALGSLSEILFVKKRYAGEIEGLLVNSVIPEFTSPIGFLRCQACWVVQRFPHVNWTDDGTHLKTMIQLVLQRLSDPALPVQIEASKALRFLIKADGAEETLLPVLPQILHEYFRIMNEIGNDEVVSALQVIIEQFGDHIEPHAIALISQLSGAFSQYCSSGEDDDDAAMAAAQCLDCISTVLKGICDRPELYRGLEPKLVPICKQILGNEGDFIEYLEHALDIMTFLTFFQEDISPALWELFPMIYIAFDQWAFDYLNLMVPALENYIGKAPQHFVTGKVLMPGGGEVSYIDLIFSIVQKTVVEERSSENEMRKALSLYMTILHSCRGLVDNYVPAMNNLILAKLGEQMDMELPLTRISIFQVIGSALHYNPVLQLQELESRQLTQNVFTQWFKDTEKMEKWLPRKLTVIGLSSILQMPTVSLPASISSALPQIITATSAMVEKMEEEAKVKPEEGEDVHVDDGDFCDSDDDLDGFAEDEDVKSESEEAYLSALKNLGDHNDVARFLIGDDWLDEDDDDDEYSSPIDDVDQMDFFSDTMKAAFEREPQVYQQVQAMLSPEVVATCQRLFSATDAKRQGAQMNGPS